MCDQYRDAHHFLAPKMKDTNPLRAKTSVAWAPPTSNWNASTIPDRHTGLSLSVVQSPYVEKNQRC